MRFTSPTARPALTPLGHRLLHLSEQKLLSLDGTDFDEGHALRKGVLVRAAVKSAWQSVEDGSVAEMTDWKARGAMGLDVLEEDDEAEVVPDRQEQRWFETLVSSFGDDDAGEDTGPHEWVESSVSMPVDDFEYDVMEAYTLPSSPPVTPPTVVVPIPVVKDEDTDVEVVEVAEIDDIDLDKLMSAVQLDLRPYTPVLLAFPPEPSPPTLHPSLPLDPPSPLSLSMHYPYRTHALAFGELVISDPREYYTDFEDYVDDYSLPPPLHRSSSSCSSSDSGDECGTPPLMSESLERGDPEEDDVEELKGVLLGWRGSAVFDEAQFF